jgi:uncharacterized membrane protein YecN with MAPEG domain
MTHRVDVTAIKFSQGCIVALTVLAFLLDQSWLVLFVGLVLVAGTIWSSGNLFKLFYTKVLAPAGLLKPRIVEDDPAPHRFAQGMAATFLLLASVALLLLDLPVLGWGLAGLVALLAAVNVLFSFCAGCFTYYQLARLGLIRRSESTL